MGVPKEHAGRALELATNIFAEAGHRVRPDKSKCWSLQTDVDALPSSCRAIWAINGLVVGGIPVFDTNSEPVCAREKLAEVVANVRREARTLVHCASTAAEGWSRVQSALLILRYSLAAKLVFFAQTISPAVVLTFASEFDDIIQDTFASLVDIHNLNEHQKEQLHLPLIEGGCGIRSHSESELHRLYVSSFCTPRRSLCTKRMNVRGCLEKP